MDQSYNYARCAGELRRAYELLAKVDARLLEMQRGNLAAKVLDLESELLDLHSQVIDCAGKPLQASAPYYCPDSRQKRLFEDDVPF